MDHCRRHVISIVDDVGFADVGWNNKLMPTPTLNSLVESEAVSLTNYYLHPTCTPSRAALMTGIIHSFMRLMHSIDAFD